MILNGLQIAGMKICNNDTNDSTVSMAFFNDNVKHCIDTKQVQLVRKKIYELGVHLVTYTMNNEN